MPLLLLCCCCSAGNTAVNKAQGKRWDGKQRRWVVDNIEEEAASLRDIPDDDSDILKTPEEFAAANMVDNTSSVVAGKVKETEYYDDLGIGTDADEKKVKHAYFVSARKWHPDRNGSSEAKEKFQAIGEAYQVLSDPKLRAAYDKEGKDGLSGDKAGVSPGTVDPALVFTFLFGSDSFNDVIGRLQVVTQTMAGDPKETRIGEEELLELERRRVIRLAVKLHARVQLYVEGQEEAAKAAWEEEASALVECRYGEEILNTVGTTYRLVATQVEGTWTEGMQAQISEQEMKMGAAKKAVQGAQEMQQGAADDGVGEDDKLPGYIELMWNVTVIDITATIREVVIKVLSDKSVESDVRKKRAKAILDLGDIFEKKKAVKKEESAGSAGALYRSAAAAAMKQTLEKVQKEETSASTD